MALANIAKPNTGDKPSKESPVLPPKPISPVIAALGLVLLNEGLKPPGGAGPTELVAAGPAVADTPVPEPGPGPPAGPAPPAPPGTLCGGPCGSEGILCIEAKPFGRTDKARLTSRLNGDAGAIGNPGPVPGVGPCCWLKLGLYVLNRL